MASTRNNNTMSDYSLQLQANFRNYGYTSYIHSQHGIPTHTVIPSLGYTPSHLSRNALSHNPVEIESALFGIGSTNLVTPKEPTQPELISVPVKDFFVRTPLIMPKALVLEHDQRPYPAPQ